jgi:hypothetical protein
MPLGIVIVIQSESNKNPERQFYKIKRRHLIEERLHLSFSKTSFEGELAPFSLREWNGCQAFIDPMSQAFWISAAKLANFVKNKNTNKYYFYVRLNYSKNKKEDFLPPTQRGS